MLEKNLHRCCFYDTKFGDLYLFAQQNYFLMDLIELIDSIDWHNVARFLCIIAFFGYANMVRQSQIALSFLGMASCAFLFIVWEEMVVFPLDSIQWILAYMVLSVGFLSALTIIGMLWVLLFTALILAVIILSALFVLLVM
ncbi:MAG: hypothetical protein EAZ74_04365 [Alphaproteobacteria bacterium]|nr:MAG: hypothetical protein EAY76_04700 [Alphaproteobacteria bacterium]TAF14250.1 MAG: hypothetical protein EAZ74_04365 [Alphaproteobacteria bacterium]TAF38004.1 MAG: hypothetical protein EAZ66_06765 [Alphaproteobacteria bacterium]TAF76789.1 MAG: hypothetical protein EAZ52_03300 [Alphaproteobacteria bacterium]